MIAAVSLIGLLVPGGTMFGQGIPNDNFAAAITIPQMMTPGGVTYSGNNTAATSEPGEPVHAPGASGKSLWWKWTAPLNGVFSILAYPAFPGIVRYYQGTSVSNLTVHPSLHVRKGETYYLVLDGIGGAAGDFSFTVYFNEAPENDDFAERTALTGLPIDEPITFLRAATREPGEPAHPQEVSVRGTLWWTWTAPQSGRVGAQVSWQYNAGIAFYTGVSVTNLTLVDGGAIGNAGIFPFPVKAGTNYQIVVYPGEANVDHVTLRLRQGAIPDNDPFANATVITGTNLSLHATNTFAGVDPAEPLSFPNADGKTVWWSWTAPASGLVDFDVVGTGPFGVAAYTGASLATLQKVGQNTNGAGFRPNMVVTAGVTYLFVADGLDGNYGEFDFHLNLLATPANDLFADRTVLSGNNVTGDVIIGHAGMETGEPPFTNGGPRTLWWSFTPGERGVVQFSATNIGPATVINVGAFQGTNLVGLTRLAEGIGEVSLKVQPGIEYQFRIGLSAKDPTGSPVDAARLAFRFYPTEDNDLFINRTPLFGSSVSLIDNNVGATGESGEPKHGGKSKVIRKSLWYTWTAPDNGSVYLGAFGASFTPAIAVYEGTSIRKLRVVARNVIKPPDNVQPVVTFPVTGGKTYQIAVDGALLPPPYSSGKPGAFELGLEFTTLRLTSPTDLGIYPSESSPPFAVNVPNPAIDGTLASVTYLLSHENLVDQVQETVFASPFVFAPTNLAPGYYSALAIGTNTSARPVVSPYITFLVRPPGDSFSNAIPLAGFQAHVAGNLFRSSLERNEPRHPGNRVFGSTWYSWTAPADGPVHIQGGFPESIALDIFTGPNLRRLKRVKTSRSLNWSYDFNAIAGTNYWIAAYNRRLEPGHFSDTFEFNLTMRLLSVRRLNVPDNPPVTHIENVPVTIATPVAPANILSVEYLVDGALVGSNTVAPYNFTLPPLRGGTRAVTARVWTTSGLNLNSSVLPLTVRLANDYFTNATVLAGTNVSTLVSLFAGTQEVGEPDYLVTHPPPRTAWWAWTAPETGRVWIDCIGTNAPGIKIYTGDTPGTLVPANYFSRGGPRYLELQAVAGTTYRIVAVHIDETEATLNLTCLRPPPNDLFANRTVLTGTNLLFEGTLLMAGQEPGEPVPPYGCGYTGRSIWYSWTAPAAGSVWLNAFFGHSENGCVRLGVYAGTVLTNLTQIALDEGGYLHFETDAGQTYQILMNNSEERHPLRADLVFMPSPVNDYFSNRIALAGSPFSIDTPILGARLEPDEPPHWEYFGPRSVWYTWTAPASGNVMATMGRSSGTAIIEVYTGDTLTALTPVPTTLNPTTFQVAGGTTYQLAIGGFNGHTGDLHVDFNLSSPAPAITYQESQTIQPPVTVRISLTRDQIKVTWAAFADGVLESTADLASPDSWEPVNTGVVVEGDENTVTLPHTSGSLFFRLRSK